ncbi:MAG: aldo/keto reductase [Treponema sp.]|nr:aldo/keto reductase [Treponema sp.]
MSDYFGKEVPKLGFGLMRLPKLEDGKTIDIEQTKTMVDLFMKAGLTYFDTAYVYEGGDSEKAAKIALVDRYPRESFTLCTKLNAGVAKNEADAKQQFYTSLERTGAGYFDYYLLHALGKGNIQFYDDFHIWDYVKELRDKGLIKYWGFSFHDDHEFLDKLLTDHPDVDFIQLQINYADWESNTVESRLCYEVARKHGKSIVVMEPVKGSALANPPDSVKEILHKANPSVSMASWAIRFAASLDGILTVLSGMSNVQQMEDNLSYMKDFKPLDEEEKRVILAAQDALSKVEQIPCTSCRYCVAGCPVQISIPSLFDAMNRKLIYNDFAAAKMSFGWATSNNAKPSECIQCGQCESACPQHLPIIKHLQEIAALFEN